MSTYGMGHRATGGVARRAWPVLAAAVLGVTSLATLSVPGLAAGPAAPQRAPAVAPAAPVRPAAATTANGVSVVTFDSRSIDFDFDWKFKLVNAADITDPSGIYGNAAAPHAQAPGFDDSSWRSLSVPHDWSIELQPQSVGGVSGGTGYLQGGLGWYRKTFTLPPSMAGKKISVDFDGVYMDSYVYLNGTLLGNHPYGYTGFAYDISGLAYTDGVTPNVLAVVVQNKLPSSRWYSGSGIYRSVHLTVTDPIHVARLGTFVTEPNLETTIGSGYAMVHVKTDVQNEGAASATADIVQTIKDANGTVVATGTNAGVSLAVGTTTDNIDVQVNNPTLWSLTESVPLYARDQDRQGRRRRRHVQHDVRHPLLQDRPQPRAHPERRPRQAAGRGPAPRPWARSVRRSTTTP